MLLFDRHNFAYLHINKTGGSTTKDYLREVIPEEPRVIGLGFRPSGLPKVHELIGHKKQKLGDRFDELKILTTIRNPYDRWVSLYTASLRNWKEKRRNHMSQRAYAAAEMPFDKWLIEFAFSEVGYRDPQHAPLTKFLFMTSHYVDRPFIPTNLNIIRLEDINDALPSFLKEELGIETDIEIPHRNLSNYVRDKKNTMDYYPDSLRKLIYQTDKYVIDKYYPEFKYE